MIPVRCPICNGRLMGAARTTEGAPSLAVNCSSCGELLFPQDALEALPSAGPLLLRRLGGRLAAYRLEEPTGAIVLRASDFEELPA